ncbi:unnamed protein product, partial [Mycena citricolor]
VQHPFTWICDPGKTEGASAGIESTSSITRTLFVRDRLCELCKNEKICQPLVVYTSRRTLPYRCHACSLNVEPKSFITCSQPV